MDRDEAIAQAFGEIWVTIAEIAIAEGAAPLNKREAVYEIDAEGWHLWLNGTAAELPRTDDHPPMPRFDCYVTWNGWPAGSFGPHEGAVAFGTAANVFTLRDALKRRLMRCSTSPERKPAARSASE